MTMINHVPLIRFT